MSVFCCFLALALVVGASAGPLSSGDKQAVGEALSKALAVMSGNAKSGSKFQICMSMFPDGAPANAASDASWQSCKSVVPSGRSARALLISSNRNQLTVADRADIVRSLTQVLPGQDKEVVAFINQAVQMLRQQHPLPSSEKAAVGDALTKALGAIENHTGGNMDLTCNGLFPNGHRNADTKEDDPTWVACKDRVYTPKAALIGMHDSLVGEDKDIAVLVSKAVKVLRQQEPLSSADKAAVGDALTKALGALEHHSGGDIYSMCDSMFPSGRRDSDTKEDNPTWVACKGKLYSPKAALVGFRASVNKAVEVLRLQHPLSSSEKAAVGDALTKALSAIENHTGGNIDMMCNGMFPNGRRTSDIKENDPTWVACKDKVYVKM